jgi:gamma-glutamyltranspeptidase / glutathione hydrolase
VKGGPPPEYGVVSCGHPREAEAGARMLEAGGNAIDAVVAAAFTGFVVEPARCGLGGYGHLALFLREQRKLVSVDHYVVAPAAAAPGMFEVDSGEPRTYYGWPPAAGRRNEWGAISVATPGAVAGLCGAQERWGRLRLAHVLEPALDAARAGIDVTWDLVVAIAGRIDLIERLPETAAVLLPGGRPPKLAEDGSTLAGPAERIDGTALERTLREIGERGARGFYEGWVGDAIERAVRRDGGILDARDLAAYRPRITVEEGAWYRDVRYSTAGDPLGYEALNILSSFEPTRYGPDSAEFRHLMAEAMGHAFADTMHLYCDPELDPGPAALLGNREFAASRAAGIRIDRAAARPIAPADLAPCPEGRAARRETSTTPSASGFAGTTQMVAADRDGNVASLITSVTSPFGSLVYVPEGGFFLNSAMRNFDPRPGRANSIAPGKRPIFAAPAIAAEKDGVGVFGAAGAGGYRIASAVLHAFVNHLDFGMPVQEAVARPRVHCQGEETFVDVRVPRDVRERLRDLGHVVVEQVDVPAPVNFARVSAVARDPATGELSAGASPSWSTAIAAA